MVTRLKRLWDYINRKKDLFDCDCHIHRCVELNLLELKIIKDALESYEPEDDMDDERTSAFKYIYDMDDLKDFRDKYKQIVKERI